MASVAVIGAGPQGLGAAKNLLEEDFEVAVFEARPSVGGLWQYCEDEKWTTALPSTLGNVCKFRNCFTDFPVPDGAPLYLDSRQTMDYLREYATHFDLLRLVQLDTRVEEVRRTSDGRQWRLRLSQKGKVEMRNFDKVVFATGLNHLPIMPDTQGKDLFKGSIIHSQAFKRAEDYADKTVLVLGAGTTAADTACELVGHAKEIYFSHRHGNLVMKRIIGDTPLDQYANRRKAYMRDTLLSWAPIAGQRIFDKFAAKLAAASFDLDPAWKFEPAPSMTTHRPIISEDFVPQLRAGSVKSVPGIARIVGPRRVELEDASEVEVDAIICATGYTPDYSLVSEIRLHSPSPVSDEGYPVEPTPPVRLYQNIFPPSHADSVVFLNNWALGDGIFAVGDLVSMAVAQVWKGTYQLPSPDQMNREIDMHHAWLRTVAAPRVARSFTLRQGLWMAWLNEAAGTRVNEKLGYGLEGWWYWVNHRADCDVLMLGVDSPHAWRLFEGRRKRWDGAIEAIRKANADLEGEKKLLVDGKKVV